MNENKSNFINSNKNNIFNFKKNNLKNKQENIYNTSIIKNHNDTKNSNSINFDNVNQSKNNNFNKKIKKSLNLYINFILKKENKIYSYYFYASIFIFILMFFVSLFINANFGYHVNGIEFNKNYSLLITSIVLGFICFFLYLPIFIFSITQLIYMIKNKKINFKFYLIICINLFNLYFFLSLIIFSILNYKLFFIHEILYVFMVIIFWILNNMDKINFKKNKKRL